MLSAWRVLLCLVFLCIYRADLGVYRAAGRLFSGFQARRAGRPPVQRSEAWPARMITLSERKNSSAKRRSICHRGLLNVDATGRVSRATTSRTLHRRPSQQVVPEDMDGRPWREYVHGWSGSVWSCVVVITSKMHSRLACATCTYMQTLYIR